MIRSFASTMKALHLGASWHRVVSTKCTKERLEMNFTRGAHSTSPSTKYRDPKHTEIPIDPETKAALDRGLRYLLPVYARPDFILSHGKGSWVWDTQGRKYLDFSAGIAVNSLGHSDEGASKVLAEQSQKLVHASNVYHNEWAGKLAELLVTKTKQHGGLGNEPGTSVDKGMDAKVFFANSGAEANEGALKIAKKNARDSVLGTLPDGSQAPTRKKETIISMEGSFHGRTMGALSVTGTKKYKEPFGHLLSDVKSIPVNNMDALENIDDSTACVILEPIQGEGGVNSCQVDWLRAIRRRCDEKQATLIYDEIQCGLFRSGTMWAHSQLPIDCHPDIVTMAKPLANGFPIGAVMMRDTVADAMTAGSHGTTFGGSPLACAVGYHVLSRLSRLNESSELHHASEHLNGRLASLPHWFPKILHPELRGRGFIRGLGFRDQSHPAKVMQLARERGILILTAGSDAVRLVPSLNVSREEIDLAVDVLESCLSLL